MEVTVIKRIAKRCYDVYCMITEAIKGIVWVIIVAVMGMIVLVGKLLR